MRGLQVALLWAVFVALALEYHLVEAPRARAPAPPAPVRARFLDVGPDALREVRLHQGGRTIVMGRRDGGWEVTQPPQAPIPRDLAAAFVAALAGAEVIDRVGTADGDADAFGLGGGASRVELVTADGATTAIALGDTNPTGTAVYARRAGDPAIVLIGRNVRYYEDLLFQALPAGRVPADSTVGG